MNKKGVFVSVLTAFCLAATLFAVLPINSATPSWDPWADVSGPTAGQPDGTINMRDISYLLTHFNSFGTPINRTAIGGDLQPQIDALASRVSSLESLVAQMEYTIATLNSTKLGKPDYDSGWVSIGKGQQKTFDHFLGTNVLVYMVGYNTNATYYAHQIKYGGDSNYGLDFGVRWQQLTSASIVVSRGSEDPDWDLVRVMMWKIPS